VRMLQNILNFKHSIQNCKHSFEDCQQLKHCLNLFWVEIVGRCMPKNEPPEIFPSRSLMKWNDTPSVPWYKPYSFWHGN
jgi:hypothetical protein